jgi:predicted metal-dependent phosphoesterase TrpH
VIKAACHVHSEWSYDGKWPLSKLVNQFGPRGYRVLLTTEHDRGFSERRLLEYRRACAHASSDQVLLIPGIEYSDANNVVHILVWGNVPCLGEGLATEEVLKGVKAANGIAVLAHPSRREAWKVYQQSWSDALLGIEIWNRKSDGWAPGRRAIPLLRRTSLVPFVGLDFHTQRQFFPLAAELELELPVTEESVLTCLDHRRFRSTAFGMQVGYSGLEGWQAAAFHAAERCRRSLAGARRLFAAG